MVVIGLLPAVPATTLAEEVSIPVTNHNFEEKTTLPGWDILSGSGSVTADKKIAGDKSLLLTSLDNTVGIKSKRFEVSEGSYSLSGKTYLEDFQDGEISYAITFYDTEGNQIDSTTKLFSSQSNEEWLVLESEINVPTGTTSAEIIIEGSSSSDFSLNIDEVKFVAQVGGQEATIMNSSFEDSEVIPGWTTAGSLLTVVPYENSKKLRLHDYSDQIQTQVKSARIPITPNNEFRASAKMKVIAQSHSVEFAITFLDANNKQVGFKNELHRGKAGQGWIDISLVEIAPTDAVTMQISFNSGKISLTDVFFDDVVLTEKVTSPPVEEIPESIVNNSFEMPLSDKGVIAGWTPDSGTPGVSVSTDTFNSGTQSLKFEDGSDKTGLRILSDKVAVIPGKSYLAKAMTNVQSQTHNIVYEVHYYDSADNELTDKLKLELFGNLPKNQWTELKVFTDVPENAAYARLAFYSGGISLTKAFFDDVTWKLASEDVPLDRNYETPINHGEMVQVQLGQASVIQENSLGENEVYYHSNGLPGTFSVLNAETGELKFSQVIADSEALWAMTVGSDKNVYFAGTADGKLYRYLPEQKIVEELGVNPSDAWVWDIEASTDGKIYGSTYPHAGVFEYDIATGKFRNYGNVKEGQQYARGIAVTDKYIYVGIGTTKHLFKIDRISGEKEEIIIEGHSGQDGMIENMFIVNGKLLVSVGSITMLVLDIETNEILNTFSYSNMISKPSPLNENIIYYKFKNELFEYDFSLNESKVIEGIPLLPDTVRVKDMEWINLSSGKTVLAMVTQYGEYILYEPTSNTVEFIELDISSQAVAIQALHSGEDGKLYMGGYQRGLSIYNPFTNKIEVNIPSFAQPEGIGFLNGKVYYGTYVGAMMYSYDPLKAVDLNSNPNFEYDITDQQDRPFTITSGDDKLFVGTVPDYGVLGGVLAIYDEKTDTWSQYRNIVQDQSIIGLAYKDGKLYGSTSVWGGLGINPKATEAKIFVWDVETGQKIEEFTPEIPGIDETPRMIGELSFGPDGNLWGAVDGTIFAMNPDTKEIVKSKVIRPSLYNSSKWLPYRLQWAPDGMLYTTLSRKLIAIDPETLSHKVLVEDFMNNMTVGANGSIYYALGSELHEIAIPETDATLKSIKVDGKLLTNFTPGLQEYTVSAKGKASLEVETNQTGALVNIIESDEISTILVSATDGKSVKEYKVHWVNEPEYTMDITATFVGKKNTVVEKILPNEKITANIEVINKQNKNQDIIVLMELLDEEGNVVDVSQLSRTIPKNKTMKMSTKLNMPADVEGYTLKLTVWEGKKIKENMVPLSDEFIIKN